MSDTPEVDARQRIVLGGIGGDWKVVDAEFARQLARERNEARELLASEKEMRQDSVQLLARNAEQLRQAREENARLREALARIKAIENRYNGGDWDEIEEAREIAQQALAP